MANDQNGNNVPGRHDDKKLLQVRAETVFAAVQAIIATGKLEDFLRACGDDAYVIVSGKNVNRVKDFLSRVQEQERARGGTGVAPQANQFAARVGEARCTPHEG